MYEASISSIEKQRLDRELMPPPSIIPLAFQKRKSSEENLNNKKNLLNQSDSFSSNEIEKQNPLENKQSDGADIDKAFAVFLTELNELKPEAELKETAYQVSINENTSLPSESPWKEVLEPNSKKIYYWNIHTNEVSWEKPSLTSTSQDDNIQISSIQSEKNCFIATTSNDSHLKLKLAFDTSSSYNPQIEEKCHRTSEYTNTSLTPTSTITSIDKKLEEFFRQIQTLSKLCDDTEAELKEILDSKTEENVLEINSDSSSNILNVNTFQELFKNTSQLSESSSTTESSTRDDSNTSSSKTILNDFDTLEPGEIPEDTAELEASNSPKGLPYSEPIYQDQNESFNQDEHFKQVTDLLNSISQQLIFTHSPADYNLKVTLKLQTETRMVDWFSGGLSTPYFISVLTETLNQLNNLSYETSAQTVSSSSESYLLEQDQASLANLTTETQLDPSQFLYSLSFSNTNPTLPISTQDFQTFTNYTPLDAGFFHDTTSLPPFNSESNLASNKVVQLALDSSKLPLPEVDKTNSLKFKEFPTIPHEHGELKPTLTTHLKTSNLELKLDKSTTKDSLSPTSPSGLISDSSSSKRKLVIPSGIKQKKRLQLVDKWKKSAQVAEMEEMATYNSTIIEEKRQKQEEIQIEKWKESQISSGAAERNVNFIPVSSDWLSMTQKTSDTKD